MKPLKSLLVICVLSFLSHLAAETFTLERTIPLTDVKGKLDHSGIDIDGGRLFVSASAKSTIEVIDLKQGKIVHTIPGQSEPQGVLYVPEQGRLYVANGKDGTLRVIDGKTYAQIASIPLGEDADNIRYDAAKKQLYVGYIAGAMAVIDATTNKQVDNFTLKAHPEAFALEKNGPKLIMNTPDSHNITVYDRAQKKISAEWPMGEIKDNFTVALDETNHRTFIGSRKPPFFFVFDTETGKEIARLPLHGGSDDFHYDAKRHQIYASCGEGYIDVYAQIDADHYALKESVKTIPKGPTWGFDGNTIYLPVQDGPNQPAEVRCYKIN